MQSLIFVGTAVLFASFTRKPEGLALRPAPDGLLAGASAGPRSEWSPSTSLAAIYTALVSPDAEQTVAQDLGADEGTFGLIAAGFMVICIAPFAEEFFFRGFFYRALRSKLLGDRRRARSTGCCSASSTTTSRAPTRS